MYFFFANADKFNSNENVKMEKASKTKVSEPSLSNSIVLSKLPSLPQLLLKAAFKSGDYSVGDDLPNLSISLESFVLNSENLQRYRTVCGFQSQRVPPTYFFVVAFPLFIRLMLEKNFPLRPMGMVHLRNQISVHHSFDTSSALSISAAVGKSELTSRGLEWTINTQVQDQSKTVWTSESTFLNRCKTGIPRQTLESVKPQGNPQPWSLSADLGRRYARVSGDYNPIHLTDISARLFGFKKAIAHGMWSKARCLAALDNQLPDAGYQVNVSFFKPVYLPSSVSFQSHKQGSKHNFYLLNSSGADMHLQGSIL
jgi:hypothetical protein